MIIGTGVDLVDFKRMRKNLNTRFVDKILTDDELQIYHNYNLEQKKLEFLSGRFAAKEAYSKALGTGIGQLAFKDINIERNELGAPFITHNEYKVHVSISHTDEYAVAFVVVEKI